ncbi:MAG: NADH-quinone oxidoreductase subunit M, partial [Planctomycetes bacterium]|nr:NADH-quinone oxidoreductase subunit M [Planctomycetota bacterium]
MWGAQKRVYAAIKFFLYTMAGSILMLIGIIVMYYTYRDAVGTPSFSLIAWREHWEVFAKATVTLGGATWSKADLVFLLFFIGFAIKVPIFPFHTWLPWAHVQAPTAVSVILAGVLLKMGTYGYLRVTYPLCPQAAMALAVPIGVLGVINIIYGACCAMAQNDMKSLVAYSSVSHMGYCMLGLAAMTPYGVMGSALQQFNHGTSTSMMFLLVGVIYDRAHHKFIRYPTDYPDPAKAGQPGFGGLASALPMYTGIFAVAMFASMGLPGLSGFVSEVLVFLGAFQGQAHEAARNLTGVAGTSFQTLTVVSVTGVILTAGYLLWMFQRVFFGPLNKEYAGLPDLNAREIVTLAPLAGIVLFFGVWPLPLLDLMDQTVQTFVAQMNAAAAMPKLGAPWPSGMPFIGH